MKIAVTGAFGYSGQRIARLLLEQGHQVVTLTNTKPAIDPFSGQIQVFPLLFADPNALESALAGCEVFINTYWVRFNHHQFNHNEAVCNTGILFDVAKKAGICRIVHTSIANPSLNSPFEYYRGKARIEQMLQETGVKHTILRPTVIFGPNDILINNIAWTLRRFPIVGYFGKGDYHIRAIHVDDFTQLAVQSALKSSHAENAIIDAVGPEDYTYRELLHLIGKMIKRPRPIIRVPKIAGYLTAQLIGWYHRDVFLTWEEIGGLCANLLTTEGPATGSIRLSDWILKNADSLGQQYASELARRRPQP